HHPTAPAPPFSEQVAGRLVLETTDPRPRRAREFCARKFHCSARSAAALSPLSGGLPVFQAKSHRPTPGFRTIQVCRGNRTLVRGKLPAAGEESSCPTWNGASS